MSWIPSNDAKRCANCANWAGPRKEKLGCAEVPSNNERGKCYHNVGCVTEGPMACDGTSCTKFQKWGALK